MAVGEEAAARRYAEAVFELAQQEGRLDEWERELELLAGIFRGPGVLAWLANPSVPMTDKEALIETGLASAGQEARNLGRLLVTRGRAELADQILEVYRDRLDQARGVVHASVTTAVPLSPAELELVNRRLADMTHRQVKIETAVDPTIIGGIVVRIGDRLIDGSARARLVELRRRLAGSGR
jgi:F-type H+-transporting ATPase subunit delta